MWAIVIIKRTEMEMNQKQKEKLLQMLRKRSLKIESIRHFDDFFNRFSHMILKKAINEINESLSDLTSESLRVFFEDPYEDVRSRYFIMIQLISEQNRRNNFYLDNTRHFPSLSFEGNEISGKIKILTKIQEDSKSSTEIEIDQLIEGNKVYDILIDFLDKIYKM